jgi:hypothetical protein
MEGVFKSLFWGGGRGYGWEEKAALWSLCNTPVFHACDHWVFNTVGY